jgi:hypothetical protein
LEGGWTPYVSRVPFVFENAYDLRIRFLYILYISVDANFKLKGKERGLEDVELMPGWGPFVEESEYQSYIANYVDEPEVRTLF